MEGFAIVIILLLRSILAPSTVTILSSLWPQWSMHTLKLKLEKIPAPFLNFISEPFVMVVIGAVFISIALIWRRKSDQTPKYDPADPYHDRPNPG